MDMYQILGIAQIIVGIVSGVTLITIGILNIIS